MNIQQILEKMDVERGLGSRFPVRIIFVENLHQYRDLTLRLTNRCDMTINLAEFCSAEDVYPNFRNLQRKIDTYPDKQILLLSVGEYLRLGIGREIQPARSQFSNFWHKIQNASSKTRIIIPLFACKEIFERVVPVVDKRQQDFLWELKSTDGKSAGISIEVYSPQFSDVVTTDVNGFKEWLENWDRLFVKTSCSVMTTLHHNAENATGLVSVRVVDNPFAYVSSHISDGYKLKQIWAEDEFWAAIIPDIVKDAAFQKTIENFLNMNTINPINLLAQWKILSDKQKRFVWIWYQLNNTDDYYSFVFRNVDSPDAIEKEMCFAIFKVKSRKPDWIEQRHNALSALEFKSFDEEYFEKLDSVQLPEARLSLLTYQTREERTYAIKTVSQWLQKGASIDVVINSLGEQFSPFSQYLKGEIPNKYDLDRYLKWYREYKIKNRLPQEEPPFVNLDSFESRFKILSGYSGKDCFVFWIDGMGCEWLPLLLHCLNSQNIDASITSEIAAAILPTETYFNEQWRDFSFPYEKWNKLDDLAHKGLPDDKDYYACINSQFSIIQDVAKKAVEFIKLHDYVLITADHGSSRLAALSFHHTYGIVPPKNSTVKSFGRYCELTLSPEITDMLPCICLEHKEGKDFLIMTTHEHFIQSGNAAGGKIEEEKAVAGEIHGGMTPEEYLVPVIVLKRRKPLLALDYTLETSDVFRDKEKSQIVLIFTQPVLKLEVSIGTKNGVCEKITAKEWKITFVDLETNSYQIEVIANGKLLSRRERFVVKTRGIVMNDDPFGGL